MRDAGRHRQHQEHSKPASDQPTDRTDRSADLKKESGGGGGMTKRNRRLTMEGSSSSSSSDVECIEFHYPLHCSVGQGKRYSTRAGRKQCVLWLSFANLIWREGRKAEKGLPPRRSDRWLLAL